MHKCWQIALFFIFVSISSFFCPAHLLANELANLESKYSKKKFFLITIPKAGTHLATKLLSMMTDFEPVPLPILTKNYVELSYNDFETILNNAFQQNKFIYDHTFYYLHFFIQYTLNKENMINFLLIRDLRDVIVSFVFYCDTQLRRELSKTDASIDQLIDYVLDGEGPSPSLLKHAVELSIMQINNKNIFLLKFETLVGEKGGGSKTEQLNSIEAIARILDLSLSNAKIKFICENVHGNNPMSLYSPTFYKGQIGSWIQYFNPDHLEKFNIKWGDSQHRLGY